MVLLLVLFAASGCAALIYEVVWYQLLQLAIGSTSVSLGILLATYMGGLCIGSVWLPSRKWKQHPLRIYAGLEAGIAVCALFVQFALPYLNRVYIAGAEHGLPGPAASEYAGRDVHAGSHYFDGRNPAGHRSLDQSDA